MTTKTINPSPSYARRKALREADDSSAAITVLNSYSIEKYYSAADRLLETFQNAIDRRNFDDAYILGVRFGTFCLESLPKHADYSKSKSLRIRNAKQVDEVLQKVERVTERMDAEEKIKAQKKMLQEEEKQKKEEQERQRIQEEELKKEEQMRNELEQQKKQKKANLERSARLKLAALMKKASPNKEEPKKKTIVPKTTYEKNNVNNNNNNNAKQRRNVSEKKAEQKNSKNDDDKSKKAAAEITRERNRVAVEAEKLCKLQETELINEEGETLKLLHAEVEEDYKRQAQEDEALVTSVIEASTKGDDEESKAPAATSSSSSYYYVPLGMNADEETTIKLLRETVMKQERRLKLTEEYKIPKLVAKAKQKLSQGERKPALHCVARKRRLEQDAENLKNAIFSMETQILLLESAVEDRDIAEAMKAAADTLEAMHDGMQQEQVLIDDLTSAINEVSQTMENDILLDEEDLLSELLQEEPCCSKKEDIGDIIPGGETILSLPSAPSAEMMPGNNNNKASAEKEKERKPLLASWF